MALKQPFVDRALPERARLKFYFPSEDGGSFKTFTMPFFENPIIREQKRARYKKYSLISRSSNLYSYLGADSRKISVNFFLSLPHLKEDNSWITKDYVMGGVRNSENVSKEREKFTTPTNAKGDSASKFGAFYLSQQYKNLVANSVEQVKIYNDGLGASQKTIEDLTAETEHLNAFLPINKQLKNQSPTNSDDFSFFGPEPSQDDALNKEKANRLQYNQKRLEMIDLIMFWVNLIRASVVNDTNNPTAGPPIIRLTHGIMYENIPCLCTNYSISWEERAGYDMETLLPRRIKLSLDLEEFRTGNFGDYNPGTVDGDNLAGFEAVIEYGSMDPGQLNLGAMSSPPI